jgi:hypothetical protein
MCTTPKVCPRCLWVIVRMILLLITLGWCRSTSAQSPEFTITDQCEEYSIGLAGQCVISNARIVNVYWAPSTQSYDTSVQQNFVQTYGAELQGGGIVSFSVATSDAVDEYVATVINSSYFGGILAYGVQTETFLSPIVRSRRGATSGKRKAVHRFHPPNQRPNLRTCVAIAGRRFSLGGKRCRECDATTTCERIVEVAKIGRLTAARRWTFGSFGGGAKATRNCHTRLETIEPASLARRRNLRPQDSAIAEGHREPGHHVGARRFGHLRRRDPCGPTSAASKALGGASGVGGGRRRDKE